jgi:carbon-monoxide dehydrogenase small subunit
VVASHDLLARIPSPSDAQIREALAGNLCRCTGYEKILDAVRLAAERMRGAERAHDADPPLPAEGPL